MNADDFFLRDYELKVRYLTDHFQRMWTRFNFFVTIESALIGGKFIFGAGNLTWQLALLGTVLSFIWYAFGAEDRFLVKVYRKQVEDAGRNVAATLWPDDSTRPGYYYVGQIPETAHDMQQREAKESFLRRLIERVSGWRFELVSTTKLAALFPLFVFLMWLGVLTKLALK